MIQGLKFEVVNLNWLRLKAREASLPRYLTPNWVEYEKYVRAFSKEISAEYNATDNEAVRIRIAISTYVIISEQFYYLILFLLLSFFTLIWVDKLLHNCSR